LFSQQQRLFHVVSLKNRGFSKHWTDLQAALHLHFVSWSTCAMAWFQEKIMKKWLAFFHGKFGG